MQLKDYPADESLQTKLDWLELKCLADEFYFYRFSDFSGMLDTLEQYDSPDVSEEDAGLENELDLLIQEIAKRERSLGSSYPFKLENDTGLTLKEDDLQSLSASQMTYLYCLIFSHVSKSRIFVGLQDKPSNADRDIMQIASTIAMSGFIGNAHSVSFGFPRPDGSNFYDALERTLERIGEGRLKPKANVNTALVNNDATKDGGIDVIAWTDTPHDLLPGGKKIFFSQVASGLNWRGKAVKPDIDRIQNHWMERRIARIHDAMCMPFDLELKEGITLEDQAELITDEFGYLLYRLRLPKYFADGLDGIDKNPSLLVQRITDVGRISQYVLAIRERLAA
ncbi:hypothetical protein NMS20_001147 [Vibrio cholerae]|nr:hypothetical protein [Vibrio cholerae]